jgi:hypothetical protein
VTADTQPTIDLAGVQHLATITTQLVPSTTTPSPSTRARAVIAGIQYRAKREPASPVPPPPDSFAGHVGETSSEKHARLFAAQIADNLVMGDDVLRGGGEAILNSVNWQNAHRALLDGSLVNQSIYIARDSVEETLSYLRQLTSRGHWAERRQYDLSDGADPKGERVFDMHPLPIHNQLRSVATRPRRADLAIGGDVDSILLH